MNPLPLSLSLILTLTLPLSLDEKEPVVAEANNDDSKASNPSLVSSGGDLNDPPTSTTSEKVSGGSGEAALRVESNIAATRAPPTVSAVSASASGGGSSVPPKIKLPSLESFNQETCGGPHWVANFDDAVKCLAATKASLNTAHPTPKGRLAFAMQLDAHHEESYPSKENGSYQAMLETLEVYLLRIHTRS